MQCVRYLTFVLLTVCRCECSTTTTTTTDTTTDTEIEIEIVHRHPACSFRTLTVHKLHESNVDLACQWMRNRNANFNYLTLDFCNDFSLPAYLNHSALTAFVRAEAETEAEAEAETHNEHWCRAELHNLVKSDHLLREAYVEFTEVLLRFDCFADMIINTCTQCAESYRRWICSNQLSLHRHVIYSDGARPIESTPLKPCLRLCEDVAEFCPIFTPEDPHNPDMSGTRSEYLFTCPTSENNGETNCYLPCESF